jgi:hypothetical protein
MAVKLSVWRAGHAYPSGRFMVLISLTECVEPIVIVLGGGGELNKNVAYETFGQMHVIETLKHVYSNYWNYDAKKTQIYVSSWCGDNRNTNTNDKKNAVFWDITLPGSCKNRRFGGTCRLHHQGDKNQRAACFGC